MRLYVEILTGDPVQTLPGSQEEKQSCYCPKSQTPVKLRDFCAVNRVSHEDVAFPHFEMCHFAPIRARVYTDFRRKSYEDLIERGLVPYVEAVGSTIRRAIVLLGVVVLAGWLVIGPLSRVCRRLFLRLNAIRSNYVVTRPMLDSEWRPLSEKPTSAAGSGAAAVQSTTDGEYSASSCSESEDSTRVPPSNECPRTPPPPPTTEGTVSDLGRYSGVSSGEPLPESSPHSEVGCTNVPPPPLTTEGSASALGCRWALSSTEPQTERTTNSPRNPVHCAVVPPPLFLGECVDDSPSPHIQCLRTPPPSPGRTPSLAQHLKAALPPPATGSLHSPPTNGSASGGHLRASMSPVGAFRSPPLPIEAPRTPPPPPTADAAIYSTEL